MFKKHVATSVGLVLTILAAGAMAAEPIVYYSFDELGASVVDESGNGNDGTPNGGIELVDAGRFGKCFGFNGTDSYVQLDRVIQDDFTLMAWVMADTPGLGGSQAYQGNGLFWSDVGGVANDFVVAVLGTKLSFFAGNPDTSVNSNGDIVTGEWMHIAAVREATSGRMSIYIDGKLDNTINHGNTGPLDAQAVLAIGANTLDSRYYDGLMDDVKIYDTVVTDAEIRAMVPPKLKARKPNPKNGAVGVTTPLLQWTAGETGLFHDVYLGTGPELTDADLVGPRQPFAMYYHVLGLEPGVTYYWRVDEIEADMITVHAGDVWSFTTMPLTAWAPAPADRAAQILLEPTLSWTPGQGAVGHHLYLGSDFDAVSAGGAETDMGEVPAGETSYQVTTSLEMDTVYYWRVDGTNSAGTVETGEVWNFTTIAPGPGGAIRQWWTGVTGSDLPTLIGDARYPNEPSGQELVALMEGPVNWSDNYGSRLYGWLYPRVSGDYTFWIASDDNGELRLSTDADPANAVPIASVATYTGSREWNKEATQVSQPIALEAGRRYYIEAVMNEGTGGDNLAVAWQGPGIPFGVIGSDVVGPTSVYPVKAFAPSPADGAVDTIQSLILSWSAGQGATQHAVYLGDDAEAVASADTSTADIFRGQQAATTYNTGPLEWGKTYYWRIDENTAPEAGRAWSFTTANFINVEDFEGYDDADNRIYQTWIDGVDNATGSYVGYAVASNGTFGETVIVHGGGQSMPLDYNNVNSPYYSETDRTFDTPQDWTVNGVDALTLYVRGSAGNDAEQLYVAIEDSTDNVAVALHADPEITTKAVWTEWRIPLSAFSDAGVNVAAVKKMYIGLGDRNNPAPGGAGLIYIDDIRMTRP